jgi:inorganic triphosphatase YgiF
LKPDSARKKFSMLCGIVARERVPITLQDWRKLGKVERDKVKNEIMKYFNITRADDKIRAELRAALMTACKAWKQWKYTLMTEFVERNKIPLKLFLWIGVETWCEFVKQKSSHEFVEKSKAARLLAQTYKNHHGMGTAGYAGSEPKWEKEDLAAQAAGLKKPFSDIHDKRARSCTRARAVCNKNTGFVPTLVRREDLEAYNKLVTYDSQKQACTFSGDALVAGLGLEHPGRTRGVNSIAPWKTRRN